MNIINSNLQFRTNQLAYGNKPDTIVLHHAEASHCTVQEVHQWHLANGWAGIGYHYFIDKEGNIYTGRPEGATGAHCPGENNHSIGICVEGEYMKETMPEAQKKAVIELSIYIKNKYGIGKVGGHKEFYSTDCPGTNYPLAEIKNAILGGNVTTIAASPQPTPVNDGTWNGYNMYKTKKVQWLVNGLGLTRLDVDGKPGTLSIEAFEKLPVAKYSNYHNDAYTDVICQLLGIATPAGYYYNRFVESKVIEFQKAHGLVADGEVGRNTLLALLR
jgi:hypothetical protein